MPYADMMLPANTCKGKIIKTIKIEDYTITVAFNDGCVLTFADHCSCCENRYFTCDDPVDYWEGLAFVGYRIENGPDIDDSKYGEHECRFLIFETFLGSFTVACHNEHNGYYGGMNVTESLTLADGTVIDHYDKELPEEVIPDGWEQLARHVKARTNVRVPVMFLNTTALIKWEFK